MYEKALADKTAAGNQLSVAEIQLWRADLSLEKRRSPVEQGSTIRQVIDVFHQRTKRQLSDQRQKLGFWVEGEYSFEEFVDRWATQHGIFDFPYIEAFAPAEPRDSTARTCINAATSF